MHRAILNFVAVISVFVTFSNAIPIAASNSLHFTDPKKGDIWLKGSEQSVFWDSTTITPELFQSMANISLCVTENGCIAQFGPVLLGNGTAQLKVDDNEAVQLPAGSNYFLRVSGQDNSGNNYQFASSEFAIL